MARLAVSQLVRLSGWRKTAALNIFGMLGLFLGLLTLLVLSSRQAGGLMHVMILYDGPCEQSRKLNFGLHLVTNVISTAVLASANFFMQILTSPSRHEIDTAHSNAQYLEIGVQSLLNFTNLKRAKFVIWIILLLTSLPLHLFFNSTVFGTDSGVSKHLAVLAAEPFIQGAPYSPMGASLTPLVFTTVDDYVSDSNSFIFGRLAELSKNTSSWERLEPLDCHSIYFSGRPLQTRRDLIVVIDDFGTTNTEGWMVNDLWTDLTPEQENWVQKLFPNNTINSLWATDWWYTDRGDTRLFSGGYSTISMPGNNSWDLEFITDPLGVDGWEYGFPRQGIYSNVTWPDETFTVKYCLSEPISTTCKVGVSNQVLLIVVLCVSLKLSQCIFVFFQLLNEDPLVTIGDAVESFLNTHDRTTLGMCTYGWQDMKKLRKIAKKQEHVLISNPRRWSKTKPRYWASIPLWIQGLYYGFIIVVIVITGVLLYIANTASNQPAASLQSFGPGATNDYIGLTWLPRGSIVLCALIANAPQVLLSICYFIYNGFFTRFLVAKEWALFSTGFKPLRVTKPKGEQVSSYWLQLPYVYAVPLLIISAIMHWLVSNCIYLFVGEGEFYTKSETYNSDLADGYIAVGFSRQAIEVVLIIAPCLLLVPILFSLRRIPGDMTIAGSNSLAISAACHPSNRQVGELESERKGDRCSKSQVQVSSEEGLTSGLMTQEKLKWGELPLLTSSALELDPDGQLVGRLAFTTDSDVGKPVVGRIYA